MIEIFLEILDVDEAQALFGSFSPWNKELLPASRFAIAPGTKELTMKANALTIFRDIHISVFHVESMSRTPMATGNSESSKKVLAHCVEFSTEHRKKLSALSKNYIF